MKYLTGEEILALHSDIIDQTGGTHGIRDAGLFVSIVEKPKMEFGGKELHPGTFKKTAVYLESLANYHVFLDGNKRTAFASAVRFLFINGYAFNAHNIEVEKFMLRVVSEKLDVKVIAKWLRKHSKKV